jgi:GxxExxY protein
MLSNLLKDFWPMTENEISHEIIGAALDLHGHLGPGLLESAYECALMFELIQRGLDVRCQVPMPLMYKSVKLDQGYRLDLLVEDKVIVELKSVEFLAPVHYAQLLTYLRLSDKRLGLLINFNSKLLKHGIHRVANGL